QWPKRDDWLGVAERQPDDSGRRDPKRADREGVGQRELVVRVDDIDLYGSSDVAGIAGASGQRCNDLELEGDRRKCAVRAISRQDTCGGSAELALDRLLCVRASRRVLSAGDAPRIHNLQILCA